MTPKTLILLAAGAAALAAPAATSAQTYDRPYAQAYYQPGYGQPGYGQPGYGQPGYGQGDYGRRRDWDDRRGFSGYPEFRGIEQHIRREIEEGVRDDLLEPEDAADFRDQLRRIQWQEMREYREHGWRLPDGDRYRLNAQLDALVDRTRDEP